jgi:hypothetical protein
MRGWLAFDREREVTVCAARRIIGGPRMAAMAFKDGAADRQADPDAGGFGVKNALKI